MRSVVDRNVVMRRMAYTITPEADTVSLCGVSIIRTRCQFELVTISYASPISSSPVYANVIDRVYEQPRLYFWVRTHGCQ